MQTRIPQLDGLRGIAILLILQRHYQLIPLPTERFPFLILGRLGSLSWSGVDLFFVLSGFLIGGILLDHREAPYYFKTFYVRRFYRILPLYLLWLGAFFVLYSTTSSVFPPNVFTYLFGEQTSALPFLTFTQNFTMAQDASFGAAWLGVTWSLAVEEQFYLVLPLIIRFVPLRHLPKLLIGFILSAPLLRLICILVLHSPDAAYLLMPCRADALMLGVLCAYLIRFPQTNEWLRDHKRLIALSGFGFLAGAVVLGQYQITSLLMQTIGYSWLAGGYACLLLLALIVAPFGRVIGNSLLVRTGVIAYGIYIFHQGVNGLLHGLLLQAIPSPSSAPAVGVTIAALLITLSAAWVSWSYFERYFVQRGHQYSYGEPLT